MEEKAGGLFRPPVLPFDLSEIKKGLVHYPSSVHRVGDDWVFMARDTAQGSERDWLFASGKAGRTFDGTPRKCASLNWIQAPLTNENAIAIRGLFPYTAPVPILRYARTIGLGDRLGIATPGHIRALGNYDVLPVLAQQSPRELAQTGRTYSEVLDTASFGVFRTGFTHGFGADADHLKTARDVREALALGYTMITLDCSEHIRSEVDSMSDEQIEQECDLPENVEAFFADRTFTMGKTVIHLTLADVRRYNLKYAPVFDHIVDIFDSEFLRYRGRLDFEISLDETTSPTTASEHFFFAYELSRCKITFHSLAPRFVGEFHKGVDYKGDLGELQSDIEAHSDIARFIGYKLSIHSGSDKFSIYESIAKGTRHRFHVKTSGTSWLAAMQLVASSAPPLYREIHKYALTAFAEASKLYSVSADLDRIPDIQTLMDEDLHKLFEIDDARQLIHITYGAILSKQKEDGTPQFKDELYALWGKKAEEYEALLVRHIGQHIEILNNNTSLQPYFSTIPTRLP